MRKYERIVLDKPVLRLDGVMSAAIDQDLGFSIERVGDDLRITHEAKAPGRMREIPWSRVIDSTPVRDEAAKRKP